MPKILHSLLPKSLHFWLPFTAMFSLNDSMRYWLYNKPVNMRLGFNGLTGIVNNSMGMSIRSGDVFVFVNASKNRIKILHKVEGGLVLYANREGYNSKKPFA